MVPSASAKMARVSGLEHRDCGMGSKGNSCIVTAAALHHNNRTLPQRRTYN
jgi:hypothetical protein